MPRVATQEEGGGDTLCFRMVGGTRSVDPHCQVRQSDGITAYQRLRGRNYGTKLLAFAERCLFKLPRKSKDLSLEGKLGSKWKEGLFLGFSRDSNEYIVWSVEDKTVTRVRSLQRKPEAHEPNLGGRFLELRHQGARGGRLQVRLGFRRSRRALAPDRLPGLLVAR